MDILKLRELLEAELSSEELTKIDDDFYIEFDSLIKALKLSAESSHERGESVDERLYLAQLKIAEALMKEIVKLRLHKIVDLAVEGKLVEMPSEEKKLFTILRSFVERKNILLPSEDVPVEESTVQVHNSVKKLPGEAYIIETDLPTILGADMREYGPFMQGDMAIVPPEIGRVLEERGVARKVKLSL